MHGRERRGNGYQRGMTHDNVLCVAAIAAETGRQLVFTEMKKPAPAGFAVLTVPTQSPDPYPLTGLPDIGHPVPLPGNKPDDLMSRYTAGLARLRCFFRVRRSAPHTPHASILMSTSSGPGAGIGRSVISSTRGNDLHSAIFFIHKLHRKIWGLSDGKGDEKRDTML
jgi:hypothetical protein